MELHTVFTLHAFEKERMMGKYSVMASISAHVSHTHTRIKIQQRTVIACVYIGLLNAYRENHELR